jgi:hypothetical protein
MCKGVSPIETHFFSVTVASSPKDGQVALTLLPLKPNVIVMLIG